MDATGELKAKFRKAALAVENAGSTAEFEPVFLDVLRFVQSHPECSDMFESTFAEALNGSYGEVPWELVQFCMRDLRWPKVRDEAMRIALDSNDIRVSTVMHDIVSVYEPEWADAALYDYYRGNNDSSGDR